MFTETNVPVVASATAPNLINGAIRPTGPDNWENGFSWIQESCPDAVMDPNCADAEDLPGLPPGVAYYRPHGYRVRDYCSTLSMRELDEERLRRKADVVESFMAAQELWTGAMTQADPDPGIPAPGGDAAPLTNAYLASADAEEVTTTSDTIAGRLGELEAAAMAVAKGSQITLHVPPGLILPLGNVLRRVGQRMFTALDNTVIADAGYPGTGPSVLGTSEVQTVTITNATGGTFTLTYSGQTTAAIPFNAAASAMQTALNALSNLDGVAVSGAPGGPWTVTFPVSLGNAAQMTINGTALTDNGTDLHTQTVTTTTPGVPTAPEVGNNWAYATGLVSYRSTPIEVFSDLRSTLDRRNNRQEIWAGRLFAATFDPCLHLAADLAPAG